jgi:hypothetical protein
MEECVELIMNAVKDRGINCQHTLAYQVPVLPWSSFWYTLWSSWWGGESRQPIWLLEETFGRLWWDSWSWNVRVASVGHSTNSVTIEVN